MAHFRLMNRDYPVLEFEYDLESHVVTRIGTITDAAHAPLGLFDERGRVSKRELNYWWRHRAIPASREQVDRLLENLRLDSTLELAEHNFGLSLSDRYWIDDIDSPQHWEDINFFDNDFSDDLGILTLGQDSSTTMERPDYARVNLTSPNSTVGGDLRKKWKIIDGKRVLVKSGVGAFNQEPYNEVVATELHRRLLEPGTYTEYRLLIEDRRVYSACDNILRDDEELVSAYDLIRRRKQRNSESDLMFYVRCCEELGIHNVMDGLARMFACDYVLANRDRHWRNFGVMRDVETLRGTRLAPIFDTGSCLWSDVPQLELPIDFNYTAKPFKYNGMRPYDQLQL
ncbi:MAG: hypothetical protein U0J70_09010, partial [Atopobiaceae bacterium]|nr:hypothetical protein [Atopobiaceae bacterium]